ncbi:MAG: cell division protein FtsQ/DivIB [Deferribacterales bacterium]
MKKSGFLKAALIAAVFAILTGGVVWAAAGVVKMTGGSKYFLVKTVNVQGVIRTDREKVDTFARALAGRNMFELEEKKLPRIDDIWVEKIEIKKIFPDTVKVIIFEERPIAPVRIGKECFIAAASGTLIPDKCSGSETVMYKGTEKEQLVSFLKIYDKTPEIHGSRALLKPMHFELVVDGVLYKCGYDEGITDMFRIYNSRISGRYARVDYVDMRLRGKIYVNGVKNVSG